MGPEYNGICQLFPLHLCTYPTYNYPFKLLMASQSGCHFPSESGLTYSTQQCSFVVNEVVQYNLKNKSTMYACLQDAPKAFDRNEYVKLFQILLHKHICPFILRLLMYLYFNQSACTVLSGAAYAVHTLISQMGQNKVMFSH